MKILLTGSSGFVGAALAKSIAASSFGLGASTRAKPCFDGNEQVAGQRVDIADIWIVEGQAASPGFSGFVFLSPPIVNRG